MSTCLSCKRKAVYGVESATYCSYHKTETMNSFKSRKCRKLECKKQPIFNKPGEATAIYCKEHMTEGMIDVRHRKCQFDGCNIRPNYNLPDQKIELYCIKHKLENMIDIKHKKCQFNGCNIRPSYNLPGQKTGLYCVKHKMENMVDVADKKCQFNGCNIRPSYNLPGQKTGLYCVEHKLGNMIDVKSKKCKFNGCVIKPSYNLPGQKTGLYCVKHKTENMIDVMNRKCKFYGCNIRPSYNLPGQKTGLYCVEHKTENMIDVKSRKCQSKDCQTQSHFGYLFKPPTHCAKHKLANMYLGKLRNPKCETKNCKNQPLYSDNNYPKRCDDHKLSDDRNIVEKPCLSCGLYYYLTSEICDYCIDGKNEKKIKCKELRIKAILDANCIKYISHDKIVDGACDKYRPDFIIDYKLFMVVLEVDENQHHSYSCECEQLRMISIFQSLGGIPVIFIRYNPDSYTDNLGKKYIRSDNKKEKVLLDLLNSLKNNITYDKHPLRVCYLFYDGFNNIPEFMDIKY
jgi:hypothetical protein